MQAVLSIKGNSSLVRYHLDASTLPLSLALPQETTDWPEEVLQFCPSPIKVLRVEKAKILFPPHLRDQQGTRASRESQDRLILSPPTHLRGHLVTWLCGGSIAWATPLGILEYFMSQLPIDFERLFEENKDCPFKHFHHHDTHLI